MFLVRQWRLLTGTSLRGREIKITCDIYMVQALCPRSTSLVLAVCQSWYVVCLLRIRQSTYLAMHQMLLQHSVHMRITLSSACFGVWASDDLQSKGISHK